jgi:hypothetical protein
VGFLLSDKKAYLNDMQTAIALSALQAVAELENGIVEQTLLDPDYLISHYSQT